MKDQIQTKAYPQFFRGLMPGAFSTRSVILLIILPTFVWLAGAQSRNWSITPSCGLKGENCAIESLPTFDQFLVKSNDRTADQYSDNTQNASVAMGIALPVIWNSFFLISKSLSPHAFLIALGTDIALILQSLSWNGVGVEISRLLFQRPRPFLYVETGLSENPAHYTSFYSGHTSATATIHVMLIILMFARGFPLWLVSLYIGLAELLIGSTGYFRMIAGRHFLSDVICGAIAGTWVALMVAWVYSKKLSFKK